MRTWLTEHLGIDVPIVSAPMAGVAGGRLAAAVSAAGALGMVGVGTGATPDWIVAQLRVAGGLDGAAGPGSAGGEHRAGASVSSETGGPAKPFGVGLVGWSAGDPVDVLPLVIEARPALVSVSYGGELSDWIAGLHDAGITVATQVGTLDDARDADAVGVDLLVARGSEGGGHGRNEVATLPLLQAVLDELDTPVIAAGGIGSARGVAAVLAAGACGAWIGTAFAACSEGTFSPAAREAIVGAELTDTVYTRVFDLAQGLDWPREFGGRALINAVTATWSGREDELERLPAALTALSDQVAKARQDGDAEVAPVYAGQSAGLVYRSRTAAEVVADLARAADYLRAAGELL